MTYISEAKKQQNVDKSILFLTTKDIIFVTLLIFGLSVLCLIISFILFGTNSKITYRLFHYIETCLMIFLPLFWIKKRYGLSQEALGLGKGRFNVSKQLGIGILVGIITSLSFRVLSLILNLTDKKPFNFQDPNLIMHLVLLPLSVDAFPVIILTPFAEEIFIRGFIYNFLRKKTGITIGLFLQAIIFSLLHFQSIYRMVFSFIFGLIFGLLYEQTKSLYSSIMCHATINYLTFLYGINLI